MRTVLKKCIKCKMRKTNKDNYKIIPSGRYSKVCNDCRKQKIMKLTQEEVKRLFNYDPDKGELTRKTIYYKNQKLNENVCSFDKTNNTLFVKINYIKHIASHIVWMYMYGTKPKFLKHINGDKKDISLKNLTDKKILRKKKTVKEKVKAVSVEVNLTPHEVLALAKEQESKKNLIRVPIFKGYKLCEMK